MSNVFDKVASCELKKDSLVSPDGLVRNITELLGRSPFNIAKEIVQDYNRQINLNYSDLSTGNFNLDSEMTFIYSLALFKSIKRSIDDISLEDKTLESEIKSTTKEALKGWALGLFQNIDYCRQAIYIDSNLELKIKKGKCESLPDMLLKIDSMYKTVRLFKSTFEANGLDRFKILGLDKLSTSRGYISEDLDREAKEDSLDILRNLIIAGILERESLSDYMTTLDPYDKSEEGMIKNITVPMPVNLWNLLVHTAALRIAPSGGAYTERGISRDNAVISRAGKNLKIMTNTDLSFSVVAQTCSIFQNVNCATLYTQFLMNLNLAYVNRDVHEVRHRINLTKFTDIVFMADMKEVVLHHRSHADMASKIRGKTQLIDDLSYQDIVVSPVKDLTVNHKSWCPIEINLPQAMFKTQFLDCYEVLWSKDLDHISDEHFKYTLEFLTSTQTLSVLRETRGNNFFFNIKVDKLDFKNSPYTDSVMNYYFCIQENQCFNYEFETFNPIYSRIYSRCSNEIAFKTYEKVLNRNRFRFANTTFKSFMDTFLRYETHSDFQGTVGGSGLDFSELFNNYKNSMIANEKEGLFVLYDYDRHLVKENSKVGSEVIRDAYRYEPTKTSGEYNTDKSESFIYESVDNKTFINDLGRVIIKGSKTTDIVVPSLAPFIANTGLFSAHRVNMENITTVIGLELATVNNWINNHKFKNYTATANVYDLSKL